MAQLSSVISYLNSLLRPELFRDSAYNGLQVESNSRDVRKVAVAVDAGLSIIEKAVSEKADLLIVHHGLLWGQTMPVTGVFAKKVELLQRNNCSLYASHLPLDAHAEVGNGFELGRFLGLEELQGFFEYQGSVIGAHGRFRRPIPLAELVERTKALVGAPAPLVLGFGKQSVQTVGIVTGSGSSAVSAAAQAGLDCYVSGEPKHEVYHLAKELKLSAVFAGHYATETFGVRALAKRLEKDFDLQSVFVDETSGI